jgi:hypothetical protein
MESEKNLWTCQYDLPGSRQAPEEICSLKRGQGFHIRNVLEELRSINSLRNEKFMTTSPLFCHISVESTEILTVPAKILIGFKNRWMYAFLNLEWVCACSKMHLLWLLGETSGYVVSSDYFWLCGCLGLFVVMWFNHLFYWGVLELHVFA